MTFRLRSLALTPLNDRGVVSAMGSFVTFRLGRFAPSLNEHGMDNDREIVRSRA